MWHASVQHPNQKVGLRIAMNAVKGLGDASKGMWQTPGGSNVMHFRLRLNSDEEAITGPAIDLRGTEEAVARADAAMTAIKHLGPQAIDVMRHAILDETGIIVA